MQKVIVNGAFGRMGTLASATIEAHPDFDLVARADKDDDLEALITSKQADIIVDLAVASAAFANAQTIISAGARPVIGTSGLLPEQVTELQKLCAKKKLGGVIAPNFSIGAVLMMKYAQDAVKYLPDVTVIETHHTGKEDAPSGTAMRTAEMLAEARTKPPTEKKYRDNIAGSLGADYQNIPVHAVRLPGFVASQEVIFGNTGESFKLSHNTINRECFMPGIVLCCEKVSALDELIIGLEHLI